MQSLRTSIVFTVLTVLIVWLGWGIGGKPGAAIALTLAAGVVLAGYAFGDQRLLRCYRAQELGLEDKSGIFRLVARLADRAGMPMPRVYLIPDRSPNAFATGRGTGRTGVAATEGLVRFLQEDELAGVLAHQLAHIQNGDVLSGTFVATLAGAFTGLCPVTRSGKSDGAVSAGPERPVRNGWPAILACLGAPLAAMAIRFAVPKSREFAADEVAGRICGRPLALAAALDKLERGVLRVPLCRGNLAHAHLFVVNPFRADGARVYRLFATHPPTKERILRLQRLARKLKPRHGAALHANNRMVEKL